MVPKTILIIQILLLSFLYFIIDKGVFSNILFDFAMMGVVVDVIIFFFFLKKNNFNSWANPSMLLLFSFLIVNFQSFLDCRLGYRSSESFLFPGVLGFCIILGSVGVASFVLGFISRTPDSIVKNKLNSSCCSQKYSMTLPIILQFSFFILFLMTVNVRDLVSGSAYSGGVNKERSIADYFEALLYVTNAVIVVMVVKKNGVCKGFKTYIKSFPMLSFSIICFYVIIRMLSGDRGPFIYTSLLVFYGYLISTKRRFNILYCLVAFVLAAFSISLIGIARNLDTKSSFSERMKTASITFSEEGRFGSETKSVFEPTRELAGSIHVSQIIVNEIELNDRNFLYGKNLLFGVLNSIPFVSSMIQKMAGVKGWEASSSGFANHYYLGENRTWGVGTNMTADFYVSFGILGVVLGMFIAGLMFNYIDGVILIKKTNQVSIYALLFAVIYSAQTIYIPRAYLLGELKDFVWGVFFVYISIVLGKTNKK